MLVVAPQLPQHKLTDVLAAARQQPEKWTAGIPAAGAPSHLATLLLAQQGNVKLTYVPYKGTQPALTDVAGGHIQMLMDSMVSLLPLARSGNVRPIAITSKKRSALAPDVPTVQESGMADFSYVSWYGVWAPKGTPQDVQTRMADEIRKAIQTEELKQVWANQGAEFPNLSQQQFAAFIDSEIKRWATVVKASNVKAD